MDSRQIVEEAGGPIKIQEEAAEPLIMEEEGSVSSYEYEDEEDLDEA